MKTRLTAVLAALIFLITPHSANASRLADVINASSLLAQHTSKTKILHFEEPRQLTIGDNVYTIRFFIYKNGLEKISFSDCTKSNKVEFKPVENKPGAFYISSSDEEKAKGIHYVLSLGCDKGQKDKPPLLAEILKSSADISGRMPSNFAFPDSKQSFIKIKDKKYQVRYFFFDNTNPDLTFSDFMKEMNLEGQKPKTIKESYGDLQVFMASDEMKEKGFKYVLSVAEVGN